MRFPNATKTHVYEFLRIECISLLELSSRVHIYIYIYIYILVYKLIQQVNRFHKGCLQPRFNDDTYWKNQINLAPRIVAIKRPPPVYDVYINSVGFQNQSNFGTLDGRIDANHEYIASQHLNA